MIPTTLYRIIIMALRRIWSSSHLTCRLLGKYTNRFVRSFSSGTDNNGVFELHKIPKTIIKRMNSLGVVTPTDIQRKCLQSLLDEEGSKWCTVVNAETGSGKTICFLLPILKMFSELWQRDGSIPRGSAAVLVPSPHLAQQVHDVFKSLAEPEWNCSLAAFHHTTFSYKKTSHLLVGIPCKLKHYSLNTLFKNNRILCLDEADTLLVGGDREVTKAILEKVKSVHASVYKSSIQRSGKDSSIERSNPEDGTLESEERDARSEAKDGKPVLDDSSDAVVCRPKVILTAATIPNNGSQTVGRQIVRLFPKYSIVYYKTDSTHRTLPSVKVGFVQCADIEAKYDQLLNDLDSLLEEDQQELPKVMVFVNTMESAENLLKFLYYGYQEKLASVQAMPERKWWVGKVGSLFKQPGVFSQERENAVKAFREGTLRVLVCSDLGSRGLDFPDCTGVIQFDFPENSEFFLHRAGRTARAGKRGLVTSYVCESDKDLAEEIRKVVEDESKSFDQIFSRNKMLRRKIKRRKHAIAAQSSSSNGESSEICRQEDTQDTGKICPQKDDTQDTSEICHQGEVAQDTGKICHQGENVQDTGEICHQEEDAQDTGKICHQVEDVQDTGEICHQEEGTQGELKLKNAMN